MHGPSDRQPFDDVLLLIGVTPTSDTPVPVCVPLTASKVRNIGGESPVGYDVVQLDAVTNLINPVVGVVAVYQVDECDASRNLNQLVIGHLAVRVVLQYHHKPDQRLGTRMPECLVVTLILDERLVDGLRELEV